MAANSDSIFGVRSLGAPGVEVSEAEAERIAACHWGVEGKATGMPAEVDENFRVVGDGGEFLLKVVPVEEGAELTDLVTRALVHVGESGQGVVVQEVVPTVGGSWEAEFEDAAGQGRRARLTTFVPGQVLRGAPVDGALRERLGATLARLALALRDFDHPAADRRLSWDLRHADRMENMLDELPRSGRRSRLRDSLLAFRAEVVPRLEGLPVQVVHNDLSRDNVVLGPGGELAVIDFGDVVRTQRINDVAVAMADHLGEGPEPFVPALDFLRGYLEVEPLLPEEVAILYGLVRTRVVTRIVGGEWRAERFPQNRAYLARNVERLSEVLERLPAEPTAATAQEIAAIVGRVG